MSLTRTHRRLSPWVLGAVALALLAPLGMPAGAWGQGGAVALSRNVFLERGERPSARLTSGAGMTLGPERVDVGTPTKLRLAAASPKVSAALRFRPLPGDAGGWSLTLYLTTLKHVREFYYLERGQRAQEGKLVDQADYHAQGLETDLAAADETSAQRTVREIIVQDDAQSELRATLDGDTLVITAVTPEAGGRPTPTRFPGGQGPPLRFLDYRLLVGGYTDNVFGELWFGDLVVARGSYFFDGEITRSVATVAMTFQMWRWETLSAWLEAGGGFTQWRDEDTGKAYPARANLVWGATGHWRYKTFGAAVQLGSSGGPAVARLLGGWQFAKNWGTFGYYQLVKDSGGFGAGVSTNW